MSNNQSNEPIDSVAAVDLQDEIDRATLYATELAISLHRKLYTDITQWEPLPDLYGLLSQIDNMMCGIHDNKT